MTQVVAGWLAWVERLCTLVTSLITLATMMIIVVDVFGRYALNSPLDWPYELIGKYFLALMTYGPVADLYRRGRHLNVDLLYQRFGPRAQRLVSIGLDLALLPFLGAVCWLAGSRGVTAFVNNEVASIGPYVWPEWIVPAIVSFAIALLFLRCLMNILVPPSLRPAESRSRLSLE